jgi:ABC-2 type transport system ATP-binding protein
VALISVRSLTKRYPGGVTALDGLTVDIDRGIVGLVGSNGAGKSTLLKILLGLLDPTTGSATVFDLDVRTKGTDIRQFVGYMPEHDCLPPDASATDVVAHLALMSGLPRTAARERTAEVLRHVGLYEERYRAIGGYSTGMKQRVKLAQALVHDPRLLLLDEPTNGLDPAGRDEMLELILRTGKEFGIATIVASHLLGEIERVCDFLVAIEGGKLLRAAPLGDFTEQTGTLAVEVGDQVEVDDAGKPTIVRPAEVGAEALTERLAAAGVAAIVDGRAVLIALADDRPYDLVRDTVAELGLPLVRMEQRRHRLEDLFRDQAIPSAAPVAAAPSGPAPPPAPPADAGPPS